MECETHTTGACNRDDPTRPTDDKVEVRLCVDIYIYTGMVIKHTTIY
jgi:hypothetical protein